MFHLCNSLLANIITAFTTTYLLSQVGEPLPKRLVVFAPASDLTYNLSDFAKAQPHRLMSICFRLQNTKSSVHNTCTILTRNSSETAPLQILAFGAPTILLFLRFTLPSFLPTGPRRLFWLEQQIYLSIRRVH